MHETVSSTEDSLVAGGGRTSIGAEGKSDDQLTVSTERVRGISTRGGGEEVENPSKEDALEDGTDGYIISRKACRVGSLGTTESDRILGFVPRLACRALGRGAGPGGVENVSIVDVDGDGPLKGVRPKAGSGCVGEGVRLSLIGESWVRCMEPITDSV
jgi:hypothetical protein